MRWLDRLLGKRQTSRDKYDSVTVTIGDRTVSQFRRSDVPSMIARFLGYTAICANLNADALCGVKYRLYRRRRGGGEGRRLTRDQRRWLVSGSCGQKVSLYAGMLGDDTEEVMDHPLLDLMNDPCPEDQQYGHAYWHLHHAQKEVCGNAFHHIVYDTSEGRPWLFLLQPQNVSIQPEGDGAVSYFYGRDPLTRKRFPSDEILHAILRRSSWSPWWGVGCLATIIPEHDLRAAMNQHALTLFDNRAVPDFALMYEQRMSEDQVKQVEASIKNRFGGVENTGKFLVASGVKDIKLLGTSLKDLDYQVGRKAVESDIMAAFGVPESMLRLNDANLASALTGNTQYLRQTILPRAMGHCEWLNQAVVPLVEGSEEYFFAFDNPVPVDQVSEATRRDVATRNGTMTINEARAEMGLEPFPPDLRCDEPRINGELLEDIGAVPDFGFGGEQEDEEEEPEPEEEKVVAVRKPKELPKPKAACKQSEHWHSECCSKATSTKPDPPPSFIIDIDKFFHVQRDEIIRKMLDNPSGLAKRAPVRVTKDKESIEREVSRLLELWGIKSESWDGRLAEVIRPTAQNELQASMQAAVRAVLTLGADIDLKPEDVGLQNPKAKPWIEKHGREVMRGIKGVNDTTAELLARQFVEGLENKEGLNGLINRVKTVYDEQINPGMTRSQYRAEVIARTELSRAQVMGERAGYEATEVVEGVRWLVSGLPCEFCQTASIEWGNRTVPVGDPFYNLGDTIAGVEGGRMTVDYMPVYGGDLHPQCVCATAVVLKEAQP